MVNLERVYGKNLIGMHDELTGRVDPTRFGWDNFATGGRRLGASISTTITDGLTIDATTSFAYWLGFAQGMQYTGLNRETENNLPGQKVQLTNCFASMYSFLSTLDTMGYLVENFTTGDIFDVFVMEPTHVVADFVVNFEMCEVGKIIDQFRAMASLDYAALADTLTREVLVTVVEMPGAFDLINDIKAAGECAAEVYEDF